MPGHSRSICSTLWLSLLLTALPSTAAENPAVQYTLDLAGVVHADVQVPAGTPITVRLINVVPQLSANYNIDVRKYTLDPEKIDTTGLFKQEATEEAKTKSQAQPKCTDDAITTRVVAAANAIEHALDEQSVAKNVEDLRRAAVECNNADATAFAKEAIADTVKEYTIDKASAPGADEGVLVQITRPGAATEWRVDLHAAGRGKFLGTYGLAVGPNLDKTYHSAAESNGKFLITRDFHRDNGQLTPAVLFSWLPRARVLSDWVFSPTVGLGFDLSQLAGFLGYSATYNRNIGLSAGIAVQRVQRLKGKYHEGQEVGENLDPADLASRPYHPNAFVAITIRSVTAPFK